jgi:beta-1,4-N-acetylglucosaminyltransferase
VIFVVTGNHTLPFDRLVREMDGVAGRIGERVVIQKGPSKVETIHAESLGWAYGKDLESYFESARIVVCHAGVGTILEARKRGKPIIVVPRLRRLGEVFDDHQLEIAAAASESGSIRYARDFKDLEHFIMEPTKDDTGNHEDSRGRLIEALRRIVDEAEREGLS